MALARWQLGLLHSVPKSLGMDNDQRLLIQRNISDNGECSAKYMTQLDFVQVMAFYESIGFIDDRDGPGHWKRQAAASMTHGSTYRLRCKVIKLADVLGWTTGRRVDFRRIDGFVKRMTRGRADQLKNCNRRELNVIIEAMKEMEGHLK